MIMQPRNPYLENMRIQRQKGCLYVCGVKFETPIDKMRTSVNAGNNILCPHEPEAPKELAGGNFLVKVVIPARLKNVIMKQLEEKGITKKLVDEDIYLMNLIFSNKNIEEKLKGKRKNAIEDKKARKELTDNLIEKIIELNPDLSDKELKQMITDKLLVMKTRNVISLKPIEDKFKEKIDKYMSQAKEVRLK